MKKLSILILLVIFSSACGPAAPEATATPTQGVSTHTPEPTITATSTAEPSVTDMLKGVVVDYTYGFDGTHSADWPLENPYVNLLNGGIEISGHDWDGVAWTGDVKEYQAVMIHFKYVEGTIFEAYLQTGPWGQKEYRRFGVYVMDKTVRTNIWQGTARLIDKRISGTLTPVPDHWYQLLLIVQPKGVFTAIIGDPQNPGNTLRYADNLGDKWTPWVWKFQVGAQRGVVDFDDFSHLDYTSLK